MARGKARFSGDKKTITGDFDGKVDAAITKVIPALATPKTREDGARIGEGEKEELRINPDYLDLVKEIRVAAWIAHRTLQENALENSVPDVKAELSKLLRWIERDQLTKINEAAISHDVWWFLSTALRDCGQSIAHLIQSPKGIDTFRSAIEELLSNDLTARPKSKETNLAAARLLIARLKQALHPHSDQLGITLTSYCNPDFDDYCSTLIILAEAIGMEIGINLSRLRWRGIVQLEI